MDATLLLAIGALVLLGYLIAFVYAIVSSLRTPGLALLYRVLWVVALIAFPLAGTLVWYVAHRRIDEALRRSGIAEQAGSALAEQPAPRL